MNGCLATDSALNVCSSFPFDLSIRRMLESSDDTRMESSCAVSLTEVTGSYRSFSDRAKCL